MFKMHSECHSNTLATT